jgi:GDP-L-fucose synthase
LPGLLRKFHDAKTANQPSIRLWGTGSARREFLHVDDLADACLLLMERYDSGEIINIGSGNDLTIRELAERIADIVGYRGVLEWDKTKPDGTPRKLLDVSRMSALGWRPRIALDVGIRETYRWFLENKDRWPRM